MDLHLLVSEYLHACSTMDPPTPVPPEAHELRNEIVAELKLI